MAVGLQLATKNSFVRVQEDINDNLTKLDEAIDFNLLATLGIEYGGILNNTNAKVSGKAYYDTTGKKLYKCIANTSINYADAGYFEALSNNDLLGKLQNLLIPLGLAHFNKDQPSGTKAIINHNLNRYFSTFIIIEDSTPILTYEYNTAITWCYRDVTLNSVTIENNMPIGGNGRQVYVVGVL